MRSKFFAKILTAHTVFAFDPLSHFGVQAGEMGMAKSRLVQIALLTFALSLAIRLPFASHTAVFNIREAEYLDLSRFFALRGGMLNQWQLLSHRRHEFYGLLGHPLILPLMSSSVLRLVTYFHSEPEKMIVDTRSWNIARITNAVIGSIAVVVWFLVATLLTKSLLWSTLFALLLATNSALVQNSAMNMPEQWLLLLSGLAFLAWMQTSNRLLPIIIIAALAFTFWLALPLASNSDSPSRLLPLVCALYLPLPFWLLFGVASWLSGDRHLTWLFVGLIVATILVMIGLSCWELRNAYLEFRAIAALIVFMAVPLLVALPFALPLILLKRWIGWGNEGTIWAGIGGAIAAVAVHSRPEGALLVLAIPFVLRKNYQRVVALSAWMLGVIWSCLPFLFAYESPSLPMAEWLLVFRALDFQQDSWRLYGQVLPSTLELITNHFGEIVRRMLVKSWGLLLYLGQGLGLLWVIVLLLLYQKEKLDLPFQLKAMPLMGLLFLAVHCIVWSTQPEPRLVVISSVFFALWLTCLWFNWLQSKNFPLQLFRLFAVIVGITLLTNGWELVRIWRTTPEWHPKALELASAMVKAMAYPDPMEASKAGYDVVSNMPWLVSLHADCGLISMPLLDTPTKLKVFAAQYYPEAFILLLRGRTPKQAIEDEPRAKAWLRWHDGRLSLKEEWKAHLELVDWRLFKNHCSVNIVAMLVLKEEPSPNRYPYHR
jgi:hypothetical protein